MMNKLNFYIRTPLKSSSIFCNQFLQIIRLESSAKDERDIDNKNKKNKKSEALEKLNLLLKQMVENDVVSSTSTLELAKPKPKKSAKQNSKTEEVETQAIEKDVVTSVKNVAESLGGDVKQTESELLSKLLNPVDVSSVDKQMVSSNLSEIIKGMKIDRQQKSAADISRAEQVRNILQQNKNSNTRTGKSTYFKKQQIGVEPQQSRKEHIELFGKETLGIFTNVNEYQDREINKTWQKLHQRELRLAVTHPPANYFQQMILWTEQGKIWKFPIDNEQGMEEEQNVYFAEHIFLEKHLEPWCPPKGPIRHFMELVCVGLSKNPYMSVKHKQEHIAWYRDYFQEKQKLLEEVGAIPLDFKKAQSENVK